MTKEQAIDLITSPGFEGEVSWFTGKDSPDGAPCGEYITVSKDVFIHGEFSSSPRYMGTWQYAMDKHELNKVLPEEGIK